MSNTYDLKEVAKILGLVSSHAARKRINILRSLLQRRGWLVYIPEQGGALGVKEDGLRLLQRLQEIGKEGKTLAQATEALLIELGEAEPPPNPHELRLLEVEVRREIAELKKRIAVLEGKRQWWQRLLMLPRGD